MTLLIAISTMAFCQRKFSLGPDYKMEIDSLTKLISKNPDSSSYYFARSIKIFAFNLRYPQQTQVSFKINDAYTDIDKAISLDQTNFNYLIQKAEFKEYEGNLDGALEEYSKAIQLFPNEGVIYKKRAAIYIRKEDYDKACADYKKGAELKEPYCEDFLDEYCK